MPTLSDYQVQTQRLLNDTSGQEYAVADLDFYINTARGQIAASAQCIRQTLTFDTVAGTQSYALAAMTGPAGSDGALSVYSLSRAITGAGYVEMELRPWKWAWSYWFSRPNILSGAPERWSVQEPGPLGTLFLDPSPDAAYALFADCALQVAPLTTTASPELLPYPYTDAVPYFAAYLALLNSQRSADAQGMLQRWMQFSSWATKQLTPPVLPAYYPGAAGAAEAAMHEMQTGSPAGRGR